MPVVLTVLKQSLILKKVKKIILNSFIISVILFSACKKETKTYLTQTETSKSTTTNENLLAKEFNLNLVNNRLIFKTKSDYQKVVDNPSKEISDKFTLCLNNYSDFNSYSDFKKNKKITNKEDLFNDPYFESMLNADKIIQIGDFIYRINPKNEKVFVLSSKYENEYSDLVNENVDNENIKVYSTGDDVLDLVENNLAGKNVSLFCPEGGVGGDADGVDFTVPGTNRTSRAAVDFNRYGIYFSLFARIWPSVGGSEFVFDFNGTLGYIHYKVRCGATADYGLITGGNQNQSSEQRFQSYQGSTNFTNYFFAFTPRINSASPALSRMVVIRRNW